jgi:hypothetical protein
MQQLWLPSSFQLDNNDKVEDLLQDGETVVTGCPPWHRNRVARAGSPRAWTCPRANEGTASRADTASPSLRATRSRSSRRRHTSRHTRGRSPTRSCNRSCRSRAPRRNSKSLTPLPRRRCLDVSLEFVPKGSDELVVSLGDKIEIIEVQPSGWVFCANGTTGTQGWAPCWIVGVLRVEHDAETVQHGELPVHEGDFVQVNERHTSGWFFCTTVTSCTRSTGWVPAWAFGKTHLGSHSLPPATDRG